MATTDKLNRLLQTKNEIKTAIEAHDIEVGNIPFKEYANKITNIETKIDWVLPKDSDFSGTANGSFKYIGAAKNVIIPLTIKGVPVTSYSSFFVTTNGKLVERVYSNNENVTDMTYMFEYSSSTKLDLSSFDTSGATKMHTMFFNNAATELDLSNFDTSKVTDMNTMFADSHATELDLSSFDTSKVTNMTEMFRGSAATELDLSSFDTSNVTTMSTMFFGSQATTGYARTQADADKFNASSYKPAGLTYVVYVPYATDDDFSGTSNGSFRYIGSDLKIVIPNKIKGVAVTSYTSIFNSVTGKLVEGVVSTNTNITSMSSMFRDSSATSLDLSSFDTSSVTNMQSMFNGSKATSLDLSSFDTSNVTNMGSMFSGSSATIGYARTQADADKFNASSNKPAGLTFVVK